MRGVPTTRSRVKSDAALIECVSKVAEKFGQMADSMKRGPENNIEKLEEDAVATALTSTNASIADLMQILLSRSA